MAAVEQNRWQNPGGVPSGSTACPIVKLTSSLGPMSGTTPGTGTGTLQVYNGTTIADDASVAVANITDKTIASGAYVVTVFGSGVYWVAAPDKCSNLS